jgi:protein TonB
MADPVPAARTAPSRPKSPAHKVSLVRPVNAPRASDTQPSGAVGTVAQATEAQAAPSNAPAALDPSKLATFQERVRSAVQAALRCPAAARMMQMSGTSNVAFDYKAGALAGGAAIARSSGTPMLDNAALAAVREARYPSPPPDQPKQLFRLLIRVQADCS